MHFQLFVSTLLSHTAFAMFIIKACTSMLSIGILSMVLSFRNFITVSTAVSTVFSYLMLVSHL